MKESIKSFFNLFLTGLIFIKEKNFSPIYQYFHKKIYSIGGFGVILIIICIWFMYPSIIQRIDLQLNNEPITISDYKKEAEKQNLPQQTPSNISQEASLPTEKKYTGYQAVGEKYGTFGDTYGSLNTLFSGLAFAILIITMFIQRQELKEQRIELQLQRKESELGNNIAEMQAKISENQMKLMEKQLLDAKIQNFNSIFFKYIEQKTKKIEKFRIKTAHSSTFTLSYHCFSTIRSELETNCSNISSKDVIVIKEHLREYRSVLENTHGFRIARSGLLEYFIFIIKQIEENKNIIDVEKYIDTLCSFCEPEELIFYLFLGLEMDSKHEVLKKHKIHTKVRFGLYLNLHNSLYKIYNS
ncbi:hypothetical protein [Acinetobacter bereziniae]|uniref:hypothetical protein n=1 Tax=Acinetobacter bereziniae TaxID=106648 RepID=UPI0030099D3F